MQSRVIKSDFTALNLFVKGLDSRAAVKVGILGHKTQRKQGSLTNSEIGAIHEFGSWSRGIPARSFLRVPIFLKQETILKEAGQNALVNLGRGDIGQVLKEFGVACERAIQQAFASSGFGRWEPNAPATKTAKGSDSPLIDTGQLQRSISSKVEKNK